MKIKTLFLVMININNIIKVNISEKALIIIWRLRIYYQYFINKLISSKGGIIFCILIVVTQRL